MEKILQSAEQLAADGRWDDLYQLIEETPELAVSTDQRGRSLLIICSRFGGSRRVLEKLVGLGADPNWRAHDGSTALAAAVVGGSRHGLTTIPELIELLRLGANPKLVADSGMPALHWAVAQHRPEHVSALLEHGADPDQCTDDDPPESVEQIAMRMGSSEMKKILDNFRETRKSRQK